MTGSVVLDIVIGLVFVYLLYSLLATILQEIIATQLGFRAKILEKAILRMLEDGKTSSSWTILDKLKGIWQMILRSNRLKDNPIAASFYAHPLIKYLAEDSWHSKPAYISATNFSKVMIDLLKGVDNQIGNNTGTEIQNSIVNGVIKNEVLLIKSEDENHPVSVAKQHISTNKIPSKINPETQFYLKSIWIEAEGDVEKFKQKLEQWFNDTMERATGWYKRYTQTLLFILGLLIAIAFNVDSIVIARKLAKDPKLREQTVQGAKAFLEKHQELGYQLQQLKKDNLDTTALYANIETRYDSLKRTSDALVDSAKHMINRDITDVGKLMALGYTCDDPRLLHLFFFWYSDVAFINFIGWILTALAISLGAPFWFDMLNKMMTLRSGGTQINSSDKEKGKAASKSQK